jgi:autotransporter translocation and assembly factor TamB
MEIRKLLRITAWTAASAVALAACAWLLLQTSMARSLVADAISRATSSEGARVQIEDLEGWLPGNPRIGKITLSDEQGEWLILDDLSLDWRPMALIWGTIDIEDLSVARVTWLRMPAANAGSEEGGSTMTPPLRVTRIRIDALAIEEPVAGAEAQLALSAHVDLRAPSNRTTVSVQLEQNKGPARIEGEVDWNPRANELRAAIDATDAPGGIMPRLMGLPTDAPLRMRLVSSGPLDNWKASLDADIGKHGTATGEATVKRQQQWLSLGTSIVADVGSIGPEDLQPHVRGTWSFTAQAARSDTGALRLDSAKLRAPTLEVDARLEGDDLQSPLHVAARARELATGPVSLEARVRPARDWSDPAGNLTFEGTVTHALASAAFKGALTPESLSADLEVPSSDLTAAGLTRGNVSLKAKVAMSRDSSKLSLDGKASLTELTVGDDVVDSLLGGSADVTFEVRRDGSGTILPAEVSLEARELVLKATASTLATAPTLAVTGLVAGKPIELTSRFERLPEGGTHWRDVSLSLGQVKLSGELTQLPTSNLAGSFLLDAENMSALSRFVDAELDGPASGKIDFASRAGRQQALLSLASPRLSIDTINFEALELKGRIIDPFRKLSLEVDATAQKLDAGGLPIERLAASGKGPLAALDVVATGIHRQGELAAKGRLKVDRSPTKVSVSSLVLARDGRQVRLAAPSTITIARGRIDIPQFRLQADDGALVVSGHAGREMGLSVEPRAFPLWAIGLVTEPLPASGAVTGRIVLKGPRTTLQSEYSLTVSGLKPQDQAIGALRNVSLTAQGTADRTGTSIDASLAGQGGARLKVKGRFPFEDRGQISLDIAGDLDLSIANVWLAAAGERVSGRLSMTARVAGSTAAPTIRGTAQIADGAFRSAATGFELRGIEASLEGSEKRLVLSRLSAGTPDGGTLSANGSLDLDRTANYPFRLFAKVSEGRLISTPLTTLKASADLQMSGSLLGSPRVSGAVDISRWDIRIPERLARPLVPIKITHRNAPEWMGKDEDDDTAAQASTFRLLLDIAVRAPREVFVRGQGVDAEFGGEATVSGSTDDPNLRGQFDLRRGSVTLLSQRITLSRGSIQFLGAADPVLDITGGVTKSGVSAMVSVKGRASDPQIALSSTPSLPQDEILSRLLFSKRTTQLSPFEAAQLAQVVGRWTGLDTGPDILERLRSVLGIDALSATTDETGTTSFSAGSYLGPGVYVGVSEASGGSATIDLDLSEDIKLRGEAGATDTKVGVVAEWEY